MKNYKNVVLNVNSFHYLLAIVFIFISIFWQDWAALTSSWLVMDGAYSHGLLLILCSCWLLYLQREIIENSVRSVSYFGVIAFLGSLLLWTVAKWLLIDVVTQFVLPALLLTAILALLGWSIFFRSFIAIALIWFAVPIWDYLGSTLQNITVEAIQLPLTLLQIDFLISGTFVELPGVGLFEVAFGCSGLRYFLIASVLSVLIAELWFNSWQQKVVILIVGVLLGLLSNWIRVAAIIYVGHESNMQSDLVDDHETFGWMLFALLVSPAIWGAARWSEAIANNATPAEHNSQESSVVTPTSKYHGISIILCVGMATIAFFLTIYTDSKPQIISSHKNLSTELSGWERLPVPLDGGLGGSIQNPDQLNQGSYFRGVGDDVWRLNISVYGYQYQRPGAELFAYGNHVFDSDRWRVVDHIHKADNDRNNNWLIQEISQKFSPPTETRHFISTGYWVGENYYANSLDARLAQISAQLRGLRYTAMVVIQLSCSSCSVEDLDPKEYEAVLVQATSSAYEY